MISTVGTILTKGIKMILTMSGTVKSMVLTMDLNNLAGPNNVIKKHTKIPTKQFLFTRAHAHAHTHTHTFTT